MTVAEGDVPRLFHFSEEAGIAHFAPRPVRVPSARPPDREWLNGPLVWAIDDWHQPLYLFPRDCPRILIWPTAATTPQDRADHWDSPGHRMIAHIEPAWLPVLQRTRLHRYAFRPGDFESLDDAGMWVSRSPVDPVAVERLDDLPAALSASQVELRVTPSLATLRPLLSTSLHISGIRLRNVTSW